MKLSSPPQVEPNTESEKYFWKISNKLLTNHFEFKDKKDILIEAINHPVGIITEAFFSRLAKRKIEKKNEKITDINCLNFLDRLTSGTAKIFILGQVILASRLFYFYFVDPAWTKKNLLPLFHWDSSSERALFIWQGYLSSIRLSVDLILELKDLLYAALNHSSQFSED